MTSEALGNPVIRCLSTRAPAKQRPSPLLINYNLKVSLKPPPHLCSFLANPQSA